jgi:Immunity protein 74
MNQRGQPWPGYARPTRVTVIIETPYRLMGMSGHFWSPQPNWVESDEGFSVEALGRTGLRYTEEGRTMFIDSEALATPNAMALYRGSIRAWDPPHENDLLSDKDRNGIIDKIRRAFASRGWTLEVI